MDILDIDEALKDDSFIFLEDKTHDDVSNILQQWKSNNCLPASSPLPPSQAQQEQVYKLNTKTFTRPKRKSAQNLEKHCINNTPLNNGGLQAYPQQPQKNVPLLNLEIGGLVTTMHKSFLQDTSPPSSICSSMDVSLERMNNSLITSADFSNINFLQSTQSLDFTNDGNGGDYCGYTLSDMIRDRKALESLTMSGDGTLIKDTHIGQIDDISLTFSKTASGSSTMDNSTDSVAAEEELEDNNCTIKINGNDRTYDKSIDNVSTLYAPQNNAISAPNGDNSGVINNIMQRTMLLSEEMIGDMTFNLVENSLCLERPSETDYTATKATPQTLNATMDMPSTTARATSPVNETFKKPLALNETVCLSPAITNSTFECQPSVDSRCETPENYEKPLKFYESTPQMTSTLRRGKMQQYTPSIAAVDDVDVSPIVATTSRILCDNLDTPPQSQHKSNINTDTFVGVLPQVETMELLDNVENPNATYDQRSADDIEMQNVIDLAQAEAQLLASNDDEDEFEHMLEEFSRVELNAEQLKMKKSLDSIKKRFNYGHERELSQEARDMREIMHDSGARLQTPMSTTIEITRDTSKQLTGERSRDLNTSFLRDSTLGTSIATATSYSSSELKNSKESSRDSQLFDSQTNVQSSWAISSTSTSSGERLLSRRSRLYDDINLSAISIQQSKCSANGSAAAATTNKNENHIGDFKEETDRERPSLQQKTENIQPEKSETQAEAYRLAERRERDRDRFKTIKIVKDRNASNGCAAQDAGIELNVPCIDEDELINQLPVEQSEADACSGRLSRRDQVQESCAVFNNNKSEAAITAANVSRGKGINTNYLTYKKPKGSTNQELKSILPEVTALAPAESEPTATKGSAATKSRLEPRSLSRPRYISGLQKFSVAKATSASDLEQQPTTAQAPIPSGNIKFNRIQNNTAVQKTQSAELKSPMGVKSKSFHNLSSNFGYPAAAVTVTGAPGNKTFGLRKPNSSGSGLADKESNENTVFKVPKLVSGLRAPGAGGLKRAGLMRPSSGYYSLNVVAKPVATAQTADNEQEGGRHSPTESMSSASSRGSIQSGGGSGSGGGGGSNSCSLKPPTAITTNGGVAKFTLTKITTGSTGIPKPSGLRQPMNLVKRSGLPKPASTARR